MGLFPTEEINFLCIASQCTWILSGLGALCARINSYALSSDEKCSMLLLVCVFLSVPNKLKLSEKKNCDLVLLSLEMALEQQLTLAKFSCKNTLSNIATCE